MPVGALDPRNRNWTLLGFGNDSVDVVGNQSAVIAQGADNSANDPVKLPVLPARANAAPPTWTEGNQVPLSQDLAGRTRTLPTLFYREGAGGVAARPSWTLGTLVTAPAAGTALVTRPATPGQQHRCFGYMVQQEDETVNQVYELRDGATILTGLGAPSFGFSFISPVPLFVGTVNTAMTINNRNAPGAGVDVSAALLVETA